MIVLGGGARRIDELALAVMITYATTSKRSLTRGRAKPISDGHMCAMGAFQLAIGSEPHETAEMGIGRVAEAFGQRTCWAIGINDGFEATTAREQTHLTKLVAKNRKGRAAYRRGWAVGAALASAMGGLDARR